MNALPDPPPQSLHLPLMIDQARRLDASFRVNEDQERHDADVIAVVDRRGHQDDRAWNA
jgi:hypothetical protein